MLVLLHHLMGSDGRRRWLAVLVANSCDHRPLKLQLVNGCLESGELSTYLLEIEEHCIESEKEERHTTSEPSE
jgi:hypothetical protein